MIEILSEWERRRELALRHQAYMEAIKPLVHIKVQVMAIALPNYIIYQDGRFEKTDDGLTEDMRVQLNQVDKWIAETAKAYGFQLEIEREEPTIAPHTGTGY